MSAFLIGEIANVLTNFDPALNDYRTSMDNLNQWRSGVPGARREGRRICTDFAQNYMRRILASTRVEGSWFKGVV